MEFLGFITARPLTTSHNLCWYCRSQRKIRKHCNKHYGKPTVFTILNCSQQTQPNFSKPTHVSAFTEKKIDYNKLSPMLRHYWDTKSEHPEYVLLYRVGDFFESFFEDAQILSDTVQVVSFG